MTKAKVIAIDWAHEQDNIAVFDGKKVTNTLPKPKPGAGQVIVTENMPVKYAKDYISAGVPIFVCNTDAAAKERERLGLEKSHETDARIIFDLYKRTPEVFREMHVDPLLQQFKALAATYAGLMKLRVATNNRLYADDDAVAEAVLCGIEEQEAKVLKALEYSLTRMPIYRDFLAKIRGMGPSLAAKLIAYTGDPSRFATAAKFRAYCGMDVRDGEAPRKKEGQVARWHHKLRSVFLGQVSDCFVKCRTPGYREIYDADKQRQMTRVKTPLHAHRRAVRKMMQKFLNDFYYAYIRLGRGEVEIEPMTANSAVSRSRKRRIYKEAVKEKKRAEKMAKKRAEKRPKKAAVLAAT